MLICIADVKSKIATLGTDVTHLKFNINKLYNYLEALGTYSITPLFRIPCDLPVKKAMSVHLK